ncbi:MAG: hypothetical protein C0507_13830 [Cyanobacteria bacterium PR.3.49]|nr:hypothetical protein [Cyanobacteria bacterium PR.3.49]
MLSNLNAKQTGLILVLVPIVIELIFVAVVAMELMEAGKDLQQLRHVKATLTQLHKMQDRCIQTFYILSDKDKHSFEERSSQLNKLVGEFSQPYTWGKLNLSGAPELKVLLEEAEEFRKSALRLVDMIPLHRGWSHNSDRTNRHQNELLITAAMEQERLAKEVVRIEQSLIKHEPEDFLNLQIKFIAIILFGFLLNVAVAIFLVKVFIGNMQKRVDIVAHKGELLALGQAVPAALSGKDELADVDRVFTDASSILSEIRWTESAVLDNAADVICSLDEKMRFSTVGASSSKVWGHPPDSLVRKSIMAVVTDDTAEASRQALERIRESRGEGKFENVIRTDDGTLKDSLWTVTWSAEKQNYYCVVNDVTEMRNVDRLKKRFIAMASHDIRSPLTAIAIVLQALTSGKRGELPAGVMKELERAGNNSQRLLTLVNDFLELEKLESNKFSVTPEPVAASEICNAARESLLGLSAKSNVSIICPKNDTVLQGDERRLVQVIINLLSNAIKYSPPNSTVRILLETDKTTATLKVCDEGPGIAPEDLHLLFDRFQQTKSKPELNIKGTGLGLAIVKNIIEAHGGEVGVSSRLNAGSTFWVRIPRFIDDEENGR